MNLTYTFTRRTGHFTYLALSSVFALPPMLFATFHEMYGISYTLLGTLLLVNFCTQLAVDLIFTFFARFFHIRKVIRALPLIVSGGMVIYALVPTLFPQAAAGGLLLGTVVFSVGSGLCEVLLSPLIAAMPSDHPERDMSRLHSLYGWGVVTVVVVSSVFFSLVGTAHWATLTFILAILPLISSLLFFLAPIPDLQTGEEGSDGKPHFQKGILLCALLIFLGGAAENTMTGWISEFMENAVGVSKSVGDLVGMAAFALLLTAGRTLYAKYGKNILKTLLAGYIGATLCYLTAGLSPLPIFSFAACVLAGFCTSMLWPGTLILMEERFPAAGVTAYALMAAGGDLGASVAPQLTGAVVDAVATTKVALSSVLGADGIGLRAGMLTAGLFPFAGIFLVLCLGRVLPKKPL